MAQRVKNLSAMQETQVQSLGREDSPGGGNSNPLLYSCLENSMDRGVWQATDHGVSSVQYRCSVLSDFCDLTDCSMPGFSVHHQLLELAQTHFYQVGDAIQPFHPLSFPSPPTFNLSQHQDLFQSSLLRISSQSIGISASASALPMKI